MSSKLVEGCQVYTELGPGQGAGARGRTKEAGEAGGQRISAEIGHTDWLQERRHEDMEIALSETFCDIV